MKKVIEIVKPLSAIVFGALFFLEYFNLLAMKGEALAIGIIATIFSVYYLFVGILTFILGEKMSEGLRKVFDIVSLVLFPLFIFVYYLLITILAVDAIGPAGWIIVIVSMAGSICAAIICPLARAIKNSTLKKLGLLFAAVFVTVLLMNLVFDVDGSPNVFGNVVIVELVVDILFASMIFACLSKEEKEKKAEEEE